MPRSHHPDVRRVSYVLRQPALDRSKPPMLDEHQASVVEHVGGPLLVLAGPGTGKTTTLVETVVDRIENRGLAPERALVLTFSRKAAEELRARIGARLDRTSAAPLTTTFHAFCYGLVREFQDPESFSRPLQLLSAAEQDSRIQELLAGGAVGRPVAWPTALRPALRTRGFARELQTLLSRFRALGLDPEDVADIAERSDRRDWRAAAQFFQEYLEVLDAQNLIDYAELVHRALIIVSDPAHADRLRDRFGLVIVDEYQDTDPVQVALLRALAGDGRDLVAVGDPDQSIYAFRGASASGLLGFPTEFRARDGSPAPTVALRRTRRFGSAILAASRSVASRLPVTGPIDRETFEAFRKPLCDLPEHGDGEVVVRTFSSASAEAEQIALTLRRAHLDDQVPWGEMAVLVRSGAASIPRLQRALGAAGVPVEVAGDEVPLRAEPAVAPLLGALRLAQTLADGERPDDEAVASFLEGPLAGLDASSLRILTQALRREDARWSDDGILARPSSTLLVEAAMDPMIFGAVRRGRSHHAADRAYRACTLLTGARTAVEAHAPPEQILWDLWDGSGWPRRLSAAVEAGGSTARAAHRDLDAICALFDLAARAEERQSRRRLGAFLDEVESQRIPADTLADQGVRGQAVRLMTAHRSKGLQWRVVVVAGVQEGTWPDVRYRGSLLQPDRFSRDGIQFRPSTAVLLAEERRLFYVAVTRARQRLVVTAVRSPAADGDQPSVFLTDLEPLATRPVVGPERRPARPMSLRGVVAELRAIAKRTDDPRVRTAAAARLASLASADEQAASVADPTSWWGVRDLTESAVPVRPPEQPVALSGSSLDGIARCPLSWFLKHEARGESASTSAQGFGLLVHALAAEVVRSGAEPDPAHLDAELDRVWDQVGFAAPWISARERSEARKAVDRFAAWHRAQAEQGHRRPVAAEHGFEVSFDVAGEAVTVRGSMDRVEVDAEGLVHVVDFKTGKHAVKPDDLVAHPQLAVYQVVVEQGAVADLLTDECEVGLPGEGRPARSGGAELVQLRVPDSRMSDHLPRTQPQDRPTEDGSFVGYDLLRDAARTVRSERFVATPSEQACRFCEFTRLCPAKAEGRSILSGPPAGPESEVIEL